MSWGIILALTKKVFVKPKKDAGERDSIVLLPFNQDFVRKGGGMESTVIKMTCVDPGVADEIACQLDVMGFFTERHGECSKSRHKKGAKPIVEQVLLVNVPEIGEAETLFFRQKILQLCQDYRDLGVKVNL